MRVIAQQPLRRADREQKTSNNRERIMSFKRLRHALLAGAIFAFLSVGVAQAHDHGHHYGGGSYGHGYHHGRDWDRGRFYGYRGYYGRYYRPGFSFGYYSSPAYVYGPGYCGGYYDGWGYWHSNPACYVPYSYGYPY